MLRESLRIPVRAIAQDVLVQEASSETLLSELSFNANVLRLELSDATFLLRCLISFGITSPERGTGP